MKIRIRSCYSLEWSRELISKNDDSLRGTFCSLPFPKLGNTTLGRREATVLRHRDPELDSERLCSPGGFSDRQARSGHWLVAVSLPVSVSSKHRWRIRRWGTNPVRPTLDQRHCKMKPVRCHCADASVKTNKGIAHLTTSVHMPCMDLTATEQ